MFVVFDISRTLSSSSSMLLSWIFAFTYYAYFTEASNILAILPVVSRSHYAVSDPILMKLAEKGHNVTVYTLYPKKLENLPNYVNIDISRCFEEPTDILTLDMMSSLSSNPFKSFLLLMSFLPPPDLIEKCIPLVTLLSSTTKYDLFITEVFHYDFMLMFAAKFKVPFITITPNTMFPWLSDRMGNPNNPSYIPDLEIGFLAEMTFWQRVQNTLLYVMSLVLYDYRSLRLSETVIRNTLGSSAPSVYDMIKNTSLIFVNANFDKPIPLVPGVVNIAGIHITPDARDLPENIEKFINESQHGVVYFCMGSLLRGETFPEEKRNAFLYAFSKIPQRVLWKWEGEVLPGKSDNIMISKWMPQRDILAHPNVKLFISHGGLLGTSEAVYEGVPVLGIPIFGDQRTNIKSLEANGAGELLDYNEITKDVVLEKIQRLLNDPKYKENAKQLSARYRDRPMSPLDTAVYWTEYVIRHKGAPHLRTAAADMPWYQYLLLDVIAFLILVTVSALAILYYSIKLTLRFLCNLICGKKSSSKPATGKKVKRN